MFAVTGTNIIWNWAPSPSYLAPFCALAAAMIGTDLATRWLELVRKYRGNRSRRLKTGTVRPEYRIE